MSEARDNGIAALQQGNYALAISLLEADHAANPGDYDTCVYLGSAYIQGGRPMDAVGVYTKAVHLQPASPQARYNLGVAMEASGYPEQALQVYDQAIQLQHDYPDAHTAIKRLEATSNDGFGAPPPPQQGHMDSHHGHAPDDPLLHAAPPQSAPQPAQQFTPPGQQFTPPAAQPGYGQPQPTQQFSPQAFAQAAPAAEEPGLSNYAAPPPQRPAAPPFGSPAGASPGFRPVGGPVFNTVPAYDDEFNPIKALAACGKAMFMPNKVFEEQAGCETANGAGGAVLMFFLLLMASHMGAGAAGFGRGGVVGGITGGVTIFLVSLVCWLLYSGLIKGLASAFGSNLAFGAAFRVVIFSCMPFILFLVIAPFINGSSSAAAGGNAFSANMHSSVHQSTAVIHPRPGAPGGIGVPGQQATSPFGAGSSGVNPADALAAGAAVLVLMLITVVWSTAILICGLVNVHGMQAGPAFGTIILADVIFCVLMIGAFILIGILGGAALLAAMRASGGA